MCSILVCRSSKKAPALGVDIAPLAWKPSNDCAKTSRACPSSSSPCTKRRAPIRLNPCRCRTIASSDMKDSPQVWLNRKQRLDMFNNEMSAALYKQPKKTPFKVETKVTKTDTFDYDITLTTTLGFNSPNTTLRMQYVLVEDKVGPYMQANYVSNYAQYFPNSAWLNKPNPAQTLYDDVARWIYPVGERAQREGILPTTMQRGVPVSQTFHLFLPGFVKNPENVHVVGLLIDTQTNEILNADMQKLPTVVGTSTAIAPLAPSAPSDNDTPHYDLSGRRISPSQPGLHIVKGKVIRR